MPARLMVVTDRTLVPLGSLPDVISRAIDGGVDAVQLRERNLPVTDQVALGRALRRVTRGRALLLVNGPFEVVEACDADGLHLPESAPATDRRTLGGLLLGRSVHSAAAAERAADEGLDYVLLGTVYASRSHPGGETCGLAGVRQTVDAVTLPVIAIGGIAAGNARAVVAAGAAGVAVISAILGAGDSRRAAAQLRSAIDAGVPVGPGGD